MFSHGHHNHPPCCIIRRSSIDSSRARQGENKVSFSESRLAAAALKKSQARLSSAVNWYNCSEETELWQHCGSMAYHLKTVQDKCQFYNSCERTTSAFGGTFWLWIKLKTFCILIDLLSYLKICSIFSQMLFNTVAELKNPAPLCLHCSSIGL